MYSESFGEGFQLQILAVMARVPDFVLRFRAALSWEFFAADVVRECARAVLDHVDAYDCVPTRDTLLEQLKESVREDDVESVYKPFLDHIYARDIGDARAVQAKAVEFGATQAMVNAVIQAGEKLDRGDRDIRSLIDVAMEVGQDLRDIGVDYKATAEERVKRYTSRRVVWEDEPIRTGLQHLDKLMRGGLGRGELGVLLGPPKRGKTSFLINVGFGAVTSIRPTNVVHYSLEISRSRVENRYDRRLMRSDPRTWVGEEFERQYCARVARYVRGRLHVQDYRRQRVTVSTLRGHITTLRSRGFHPDLVVVDYADELRPEGRYDNPRHGYSEVYRDLRRLAAEFDCALWTASQTNRAAYSKETPDMSDFAEDFGKAAILDAGVAFCQTEAENEAGRCRLFLMGGREFEDSRTVECVIDRAHCHITTMRVVPKGERTEEKPTSRKRVTKFIGGVVR